MKLSVSHKTTYRFEAPVQTVLQVHRLRPSEYLGQSITNWSVDMPGAISGAPYRDGAGDLACAMAVRGPADEVTVMVQGVVETKDLSGVLKGHKERARASVFRRATSRTRPDAAIETLAQGVVAELPVADTLGRAHALSEAVTQALTYRSDSTDTTTTAAHALKAGEGVCQDFTHVLIAMAHAVDLPARYVTGYLFTENENQEPEATHAWAEIYVTNLGWVGFDAVHACCPDARYIRLCSGFDSADAAPIRGLATGMVAQEDLSVQVQVSQVQQ